MNDSDDDGLAWWANNDGTGYFRITDMTSGDILNLEPDFGNVFRI